MRARACVLSAFLSVLLSTALAKTRTAAKEKKTKGEMEKQARNEQTTRRVDYTPFALTSEKWTIHPYVSKMDE